MKSRKMFEPPAGQSLAVIDDTNLDIMKQTCCTMISTSKSVHKVYQLLDKIEKLSKTPWAKLPKSGAQLVRLLSKLRSFVGDEAKYFATIQARFENHRLMFDPVRLCESTWFVSVDYLEFHNLEHDFTFSAEKDLLRYGRLGQVPSKLESGEELEYMLCKLHDWGVLRTYSSYYPRYEKSAALGNADMFYGRLLPKFTDDKPHQIAGSVPELYLHHFPYEDFRRQVLVYLDTLDACIKFFNETFFEGELKC